jgi:hypothetical protein
MGDSSWLSSGAAAATATATATAAAAEGGYGGGGGGGGFEGSVVKGTGFQERLGPKPATATWPKTACDRPGKWLWRRT